MRLHRGPARPAHHQGECHALGVAWLRAKHVDRQTFHRLAGCGSRIHYETHFAPLLQLQGQLAGITVDLVTAEGARLPVFLTANIKSDTDGRPILLRITIQDAGTGARTSENSSTSGSGSNENARGSRCSRGLCNALCCRPCCHRPKAWMHLPTTTPPPQTMSAEISTICSRSSHDKWAFFIGDVSGKGAGAAAVTSLTRYTLRAAAVFDADPVAVLQNLHAVLSQEFRDTVNQFATVIFGVLTPHDGEFDVNLASGGHLPPLVLGADGVARYVDIDRWPPRRHPHGAEVHCRPNSTRAGRHAGALHGWVDRGANRQRHRALRLLTEPCWNSLPRKRRPRHRRSSQRSSRSWMASVRVWRMTPPCWRWAYPA